MADKTIEKAKQNIEKHGFSIMAIGAGESTPSFAYTVGLTQTYNHPEIVVFGTGLEGAQCILNAVADKIKKGEMMSTTKKYQEFTNGFDSVFVTVEKEKRDEHFILAKNFYGDRFRAMQLVWSDTKNRFPWEADFDEKLDAAQIILGTVLNEMS